MVPEKNRCSAADGATAIIQFRHLSKRIKYIYAPEGGGGECSEGAFKKLAVSGCIGFHSFGFSFLQMDWAHCKNQYRKFETYISRKGAVTVPVVSDLYIPTINLPILLQEIS
jgi:hypothetical protein